ncbi:MAG: 3-phenylpropionate/cinnamic acid dioxygenase subunit beta [Acidimicrobiaceae bacterium]|nr:3-phenylpropionate/cinnamic acid dioxygenase subunit beta [Acidimicrobiaceae bacterium]
MTGRPRVDPALFADVSGWLSWEAELLDERRYRDWLGALADDITYRMPVRVTTAVGTAGPVLGDMVHFDEDRYTLGLRVERLEGRHAWTEDPPSRTRRFVTNVRVTPPAGHQLLGGIREVEVRSYLLLFRSRGDVREADFIATGRTDVLRRREPVDEGGDDDWLLARREIAVDEAVLRTQNLAVFL